MIARATSWEVSVVKDDRTSAEEMEMDGRIVRDASEIPVHVQCRCVLVPHGFETEDQRIARMLQDAVAVIRGDPSIEPVGILDAQSIMEEKRWVDVADFQGKTYRFRLGTP